MTTLRYYVRLADGAVFAIECRDGRPLRAVGPVADCKRRQAVELDDRDAVDATGWDMGGFATADRDVFGRPDFPDARRHPREDAVTAAIASGTFATHRTPPGTLGRMVPRGLVERMYLARRRR
jgi:hypothetical protein